MPNPINATTACLPGFSFSDALTLLRQGVSEPLIGTLATDHAQLCPQSTGHLSPAECERLRDAFPGTQLRCHANARIWERHVRYDASTFCEGAKRYFTDMADRSRRLGAAAYSLHAGYRHNCSLDTMFDNVERIQEMFGDIAVAVEGLYRNEQTPQLMDGWAGYEAALRRGLKLAVDLSHLKIIAKHEGDASGLTTELLSSTNTIEVHLSDNNAVADQHSVLVRQPDWWQHMGDIQPNAVIFSEGNQVRRLRLKDPRSARNSESNFEMAAHVQH